MTAMDSVMHNTDLIREILSHMIPRNDKIEVSDLFNVLHSLKDTSKHFNHHPSVINMETDVLEHLPRTIDTHHKAYHLGNTAVCSIHKKAGMKAGISAQLISVMCDPKKATSLKFTEDIFAPSFDIRILRQIAHVIRLKTSISKVHVPNYLLIGLVLVFMHED